MKNLKREIIYFFEIFLRCKAYCSGCNINKNLSKEILFSNDDLVLINKRILDYNKHLTEKTNVEHYSSITLGPADFLSLPFEDIKNVTDMFNDEIVLILAGNLSLKDEKEKIYNLYDYSIKNNKKITLQIIYNPLMKEKEQFTLKNNIQYIKDTFKIFDTVCNLSNSIYEKLTPKELLDNFLNFNINYIALVSSPNNILLNKKEFQTSLINETDYLFNLLKVYEDYKDDLDLEVYENRGLFFKQFDLTNKNLSYYKNIISYHHSKILFVDKDLGLRISCENIGDYHYVNENDFKPLINLKENDIKDAFETPYFNKIITKQISGITTDKICIDCDFKLYCMSTPVYWQKKQYENIKGIENNEYCYGLKKINNYIYKNISHKE